MLHLAEKKEKKQKKTLIGFKANAMGQNTDITLKLWKDLEQTEKKRQKTGTLL